MERKSSDLRHALRPFYPLLDAIWDDYESHIKTLSPENHAKGLCEMLTVESKLDEKYSLFYVYFRAFRKLRSKERQEACAKYLVYRYPKKYQLARDKKNAVEPVLMGIPNDPRMRRQDPAEREFIVRVPCRVISHYNFTDEPMDLDIAVEADSAYEAVRDVELNLRHYIQRKPS